LLPRLAQELPSIDLFLHDDLHTPRHLAFELRTVRPHLTPGAVVMADNTVWTGASFPRFAQRAGVRVHRRRRDDLVGLRWPG
jgi:predicted O-methyltransferase YrrM